MFNYPIHNRYGLLNFPYQVNNRTTPTNIDSKSINLKLLAEFSWWQNRTKKLALHSQGIYNTKQTNKQKTPYKPNKSKTLFMSNNYLFNKEENY